MTSVLLVWAFGTTYLLFTVGRELMALYLSSAAVISAYGAAGSLIVLLMWIYFSSAVLLFAAGCAKAVEEARDARSGGQPQPARGRYPPLRAVAGTRHVAQARRRAR